VWLPSLLTADLLRVPEGVVVEGSVSSGADAAVASVVVLAAVVLAVMTGASRGVVVVIIAVPSMSKSSTAEPASPLT
jgi:hypothetical protein